MGRTNTSHRRTQKSVGLKDTAKPINPLGQERDSSSNHRWLRCLIAFFVFGIILLKVIQSSPWKCSNAKSSSNLARSCFANAGWGKWRRGVPDQRYTSNSHIQWAQILQITSKLDAEKKALNIGLLNFNSTEIKQWKNLFPTAEFSKIHLKKAGKELTWNDDLYPEWINEEKEEEFDFPSCPNLPDPEIPKSLQLGLVAVKLPCDKTSNWTRDIPRLHLQLAAAKLSVHSKEGNDDPAHVLVVTDCLPIPNLFSCKNNEWNYSKFRLWQLTEYDKIIFIDSDLLVLRNIDFLFTMPEISATGNNGTLFNSGVMVIEPSNCTFKLLIEHINDIKSYNGGDQGYLNEIFTWWHRIPRHMNFLKHFWIGDEEEKKAKKTHLFGAEPPVLYVLHYLGFKPWLCFRDYDCNWNVNFMQEFASDVAHQKWWRVHDSMPKRLQKFCLLSTQRKANLEWERRQAEKADYSDGHWKRNVTDARLRICKDDYCDWKSMLLHWGDP